MRRLVELPLRRRRRRRKRRRTTRRNCEAEV
jgi:hypothetical protein